jgi:hypothetical protein
MGHTDISKKNIEFFLFKEIIYLFLKIYIHVKMDYYPPIQPKTFKRNYLIYILIFVVFILAGLVIFFALRNENTKSTFIEPAKCPVIKSNYASLPNINPNSITIINQCSLNPDGSNGIQACTFSGITNLFDAEAICNKYSISVCGGFIYNPSTEIMSFINATVPITQDSTASVNNQDVYLKQT